MGYTLNFSAVWRSFDLLLEGLALSLVLAFVAILIGCAIGLVTAFCLMSKSGLAVAAPPASTSRSFATRRFSSSSCSLISRCRSSACGSTRSKASS